MEIGQSVRLSIVNSAKKIYEFFVKTSFTMKLVMGEANVFKEIINILDSLINEGTFKFDGEKLSLKAIDSANVCMIDLEITKDSFLESEGEGKFKVKIKDLKDALKKAKKGDILCIELDKEKNRLKILLKGVVKRIFYVPLIAEEDEDIPEAKLDEFKTTIEIDSKVFKEIIESLETITESIIFESEKEKVRFSGGDELEEAVIEVDKMNESVLVFEVEEPSKAIYGVDYLKKMIKAQKFAPTVILKFANNYPLELTYKNLDYIRMTFILAPKLE